MTPDTAHQLFDELDELFLVARLTGFTWDQARAERAAARLAAHGFYSRNDVPRETQQQEDPRLLAA